MSITVGRLELAHPLLNASGTWDAVAAQRLFGEANPGMAGFVTKTVTPEPRPGNPAPRIAPSRQGLLNSIGLPGPGRDAFLQTLLPELATIVQGPIICSVGGFSVADYVGTVEQLEHHSDCDAIELNVSCPNVESGCASIGGDAGETERLTAAARAATGKPLFVKLSASVADIAEIARAAQAGGADGLVCINTVKATAIIRWTHASLFGGGGGGLSGAAIKPVALHAVLACRDATGLDIIGLGGVETRDDVEDLLSVGASAVAIGTALFRDPALALRLRDELAA
ncbi:MAG: dihydroorotate dehydrogenase catalytic subunit [Gaiellales bacterium]